MTLAIRLVNTLLMAKQKYSKDSPKMCRQFSEKLLFTNPVQSHFAKAFKFYENLLRTSQKIISHEFCQKHLLEYYNVQKFAKNFETILGNVRFQLCLAAESIAQDDAILPDEQPIKLRESRAG